MYVIDGIVTEMTCWTCQSIKTLKAGVVTFAGVVEDEALEQDLHYLHH